MRSLLRRVLHPRTCASSVRNLDGSLLWCAERSRHQGNLHRSASGIEWGGRMSSGIAVVVHPPSAGPVRPNEEPTP